MSQFDPPPSEVIPDLPPEPPAWPKVIGIISIVWASLGLFCGVCGLASPFVMKSLIPAEQASQMPDFTPPPILLGLGAVSLLFTFVLMVAGIMTLRRKPVGSVMHLVYAVVALLMLFPSIYFQMQQQASLKQWAQENPNSDFAKQMNNPGQSIGQAVGMAFGIVLGGGYPLFLVIWFGAVKRGPAAYGPRESRPMI